MLRSINRGPPRGEIVFWAEKDQKHPYTMMEVSYPATFQPKNASRHALPSEIFKMTARPPSFSIDLRAAVKRQIAFARDITSLYPYDPVPEKLLLDSQQRFAKFMDLIRMNQNPAIVPAVQIDLLWHTH
jgi:hypothetical protein